MISNVRTVGEWGKTTEPYADIVAPEILCHFDVEFMPSSMTGPGPVYVSYEVSSDAVEEPTLSVGAAATTIDASVSYAGRTLHVDHPESGIDRDLFAIVLEYYEWDCFDVGGPDEIFDVDATYRVRARVESAPGRSADWSESEPNQRRVAEGGLGGDDLDSADTGVSSPARSIPDTPLTMDHRGLIRHDDGSELSFSNGIRYAYADGSGAVLVFDEERAGVDQPDVSVNGDASIIRVDDQPSVDWEVGMRPDGEPLDYRDVAIYDGSLYAWKWSTPLVQVDLSTGEVVSVFD